MSSQFVMQVMVLAPFNSSAAAVVFTRRTGVSKSMDGWGAICAHMNLQICALEPSPRCVARSHGRACAGDDVRGGRKGGLCVACSHAGRRIGGTYAHSETFTGIHRYSHTFADVQRGQKCGAAVRMARQAVCMARRAIPHLRR